METVVIVGGSGDIGRHICFAAIEQGYDVLAIGRNADALQREWAGYEGERRLHR